jgi:hypothetical protein
MQGTKSQALRVAVHRSLGGGCQRRSWEEGGSRSGSLENAGQRTRQGSCCQWRAASQRQAEWEDGQHLCERPQLRPSLLDWRAGQSCKSPHTVYHPLRDASMSDFGLIKALM